MATCSKKGKTRRRLWIQWRAQSQKRSHRPQSAGQPSPTIRSLVSVKDPLGLAKAPSLQPLASTQTGRVQTFLFGLLFFQTDPIPSLTRKKGAKYNVLALFIWFLRLVNGGWSCILKIKAFSRVQALVWSNKPKEFATSLTPFCATWKDKDFSRKKTVANSPPPKPPPEQHQVDHLSSATGSLDICWNGMLPGGAFLGFVHATMRPTSMKPNN